MDKETFRMLEEADRTLAEADLANPGAYDQGWHWLSGEQRKSVERSREAIGKALEWLKGIEAEELETLRLREATETLRVLEQALIRVERLHGEGNADGIREQETPLTLQTKLVAIKHQFEAATATPGKRLTGWRRIAAALGLAAGIAAGGLAAQARSTAPTAAQQGELQPGYYLQFSATRNMPDRIGIRREYGVDLVIHKTRSDVPFKLLYPRWCKTKEEAEGAIRTLDEIPESIGIVKLLPNGETQWIKTVEEEIIEQASRPRQRRDYDALVHEAIARYWPKDMREIRQGSKTYEIERLMLAVIEIESAEGKLLVSGAGARGPMQIMPAMFRKFYPLTGLGGQGNINDFRDNIYTGVLMYKSLFERNYPKYTPKQILQMYNYGEGRVRRAAKLPEAQRDARLPRETREYFGKVEQAYYPPSEGR